MGPCQLVHRSQSLGWTDHGRLLLKWGWGMGPQGWEGSRQGELLVRRGGFTANSGNLDKGPIELSGHPAVPPPLLG